MDEQRGPRPGRRREIDRLVGRQVAALGVVESAVAQGGLDQQQVGAAGELDGTASVGPVSPV